MNPLIEVLMWCCAQKSVLLEWRVERFGSKHFTWLSRIYSCQCTSQNQAANCNCKSACPCGTGCKCSSQKTGNCGCGSICKCGSSQ
ncbi:cadmium-metallothionein-like isoform X3 [Lucilia cuprina]|uniref:cadmium-metallothionein-like isoform X3 n=1 Tax=Lucilia cuprina TaxID=7375 RepID=UPI001F06CC4A|nr:cadmium-metallothionein-like isoform X3 [Lucilia cuprina]